MASFVGAGHATRGSVNDQLVEAVDVLPTAIEAVGGHVADERLEGRSLLPLLDGQAAAPRQAVFCEWDFAWFILQEDVDLDIGPAKSRAWMVRTDRWKYVRYDAFRPQLFDLSNDPVEQHDLGRDEAHVSQRRELDGMLHDWLRDRRNRVTVRPEDYAYYADPKGDAGFKIGIW